MKKLNFKRITFMVFMVAALLSSSCKRELEIEEEAQAQGNYDFTIELVPVPKSIKKGESVDLLFSVVQHGYTGAFTFRYFQSEGSGVLASDTATLDMDREYRVASDGKITLHYTSNCETAQRLDFIFIDPLGNRKDYTVRFSAQTEVDRSFSVLLAPARSVIRSGEAADLAFEVVCPNPYDDAAYMFRYFQTEGMGKVLAANSTVLAMDRNYAIAQDGKVNLKYISNCHTNQKLVFTFEDQIGNRVEYPVSFSDMGYPYFGIQVPLNDISFPIHIYRNVFLNFTITGINQYAVKDFKFSYSLVAGTSAFALNGSALNQNQWYPVPENGLFTLRFTPQSHALHKVKFIVEDTYGNREELILELDGR